MVETSKVTTAMVTEETHRRCGSISWRKHTLSKEKEALLGKREQLVKAGHLKVKDPGCKDKMGAKLQSSGS